MSACLSHRRECYSDKSWMEKSAEERVLLMSRLQNKSCNRPVGYSGGIEELAASRWWSIEGGIEFVGTSRSRELGM